MYWLADGSVYARSMRAFRGETTGLGSRGSVTRSEDGHMGLQEMRLFRQSFN